MKFEISMKIGLIIDLQSILRLPFCS